MAIIAPTPIDDASLPLPDRADRATFADRMAEQFRWQREDLAAGVNSLADVTYNNALEASSAATGALAASNFKGLWSDLSGALMIPASVSHSGAFWTLLNSVADVTAEEPGVSSVWQVLGGVPLTGGVALTGPIEVPSGATGAEVPQAQEVVGKTSTTGSAKMPAGTTAQRDGSPSIGYTRWNTSLDCNETWNGTHWVADGIVESAVVNTNSGTSHEIAGIPPWAKRITVHFRGVSTTGSQYVVAQIGDSAIVTSGYSSTSLDLPGAVDNVSTSGLTIRHASAANALIGEITIVKEPGTFTYKMSAYVRRNDASGTIIAAIATVTLSAAMERFAIVRQGSDTFDAGKMWITWEN